jgi:polysaccharide deacetylase 2 family uncharacterized protein YibQ
MTQHTDNEDQAAPPRPGPFSSMARNRTAAWIVLALLAGLAGGFFLSRQFPPAPAPPAQNATVEEPREADLRHRAKQADQALLNALAATHRPGAAPQTVSTEQRENAGQEYPFKILRLPHVDSQQLHDRLAKELASLSPGAKLIRISPQSWDIIIDGVPTHRLNFPEEAAKPEDAAKRAKGRMAIVIDDMGEDVGLARDLAKFDVPMAFSIWPDSSHREEVLKIAKASGREIFIHLPMQPKGYPKVAPGPHALLTSMTADQIRDTVRRSVKRVHGAIAINNHMGSEFTEFRPGMRAALTTMHEEGLFFLDSRTSAASIAVSEAKRIGLRVQQRDVFLDNDLSVPAIVKQLRKAEAAARQHGNVIAIGHPHKETVAALRAWLKEKDASVQIVTVTSLPPL